MPRRNAHAFRDERLTHSATDDDAQVHCGCADNSDVKAILTVIVYLALVMVLAIVTLFTRRPEPNNGLDDED